MGVAGPGDGRRAQAQRLQPEGKPWAKAGDLVTTEYASGTGTPSVSLVSPGGHAFPAEAPKLIVKFLQAHPAK